MNQCMTDAEMDMWHAEHTLETTAPPERIWAQMQMVADWPQWDTGLISAELPGAFSAGAQGFMQSSSAEPRSFLLASVSAQHEFTALTRLPLAEVRHIHHQETSSMGTRITHRIEIRGPLSWLYGWSVGRRLRDDLAPSMRRLARLAS
jgi:hypothetical protein